MEVKTNDNRIENSLSTELEHAQDVAHNLRIQIDGLDDDDGRDSAHDHDRTDRGPMRAPEVPSALASSLHGAAAVITSGASGFAAESRAAEKLLAAS